MFLFLANNEFDDISFITSLPVFCILYDIINVYSSQTDEEYFLNVVIVLSFISINKICGV